MSADLSSLIEGVFIQQEKPSDLIEVGKIATVHGVRGWLKVQTYSSTAEALKKSSVWWLKAPNPLDSGAVSIAAVKIKTCQPHGEGLLLASFESLTDRDKASALRGYTIWLPRAEFPAVQKDEYYWVDLIGCKFYGLNDDKPVLLGLVDAVQENSAHAILSIALGEFDNDQFKPKLDQKNRPQYTMVPFVRSHVHEINLKAKEIFSDWPNDF